MWSMLLKNIFRDVFHEQRPLHMIDVGNVADCKCSYGNPSGNAMSFGTFFYYVYFTFL